MKYLTLPSEAAAQQRSRQAWESRIGRKKHPEDVTEFLWGWDVGKDGRTALVIDDETLLSSDEKREAVTRLPNAEGENWYKPEKVGL